MDFKAANFADELIKRNIKPSHQRIKILEYLFSHRNHPTAEAIYSGLKAEMPTLSRSTVYNTVSAFVEEHLVQEVTIEENEVRYDADTRDHGHFKCTLCGCVYDFGIDIGAFPAKDLSGFRIDSKSVYFKGICPKCLPGGTGG
jgi:Fur family peroxide stress response transcriptional regulator